MSELIRKAEKKDLCRIAEILVFNNRMNYLPIFQDETYSFNDMQVTSVMDEFLDKLDRLYVYDDGVIRGFVCINDAEIEKLYVDSFFQGNGYGSKLIEFALENFHVNFLWCLEKNEKALRFYKRHGFAVTEKKKYEEGTLEYLLRLEYIPGSSQF